MPHKDEIPILEHEIGLNTKDEIHGNSIYVKQYGHSSTTFKLAIVTMVIFVSALLFIFLFLITPVFYSLNHPAGEAAPHQHDMPMPDQNKSMGDGHSTADHNEQEKPTSEQHSADDHMSHDHGRRKKRSLSELKDAVKQRSLKACPCLKTLPSSVDSSKRLDCLLECGMKLWQRHDAGNSQRSINNPLKFH